MWTSVLFKVLTSKLVEDLVASGLNWLLNHKTAGIGRELATTALNAVAKSRANNVPVDAFDAIKESL